MLSVEEFLYSFPAHKNCFASWCIILVVKVSAFSAESYRIFAFDVFSHEAILPLNLSFLTCSPSERNKDMKATCSVHVSTNSKETRKVRPFLFSLLLFS